MAKKKRWTSIRVIVPQDTRRIFKEHCHMMESNVNRRLVNLIQCDLKKIAEANNLDLIDYIGLLNYQVEQREEVKNKREQYGKRSKSPGKNIPGKSTGRD